MRMLLPEPSDTVDLVAVYAPPEPAAHRPFVRCNMISTFDGVISVQGRSGMLGGPADRKVFQVLRSWADVVLVGAGTARGEGYGPVRFDEQVRRMRLERGQQAVPPVAVVTRSGNLDWASPFFTEASSRPIVFSSDEADEGTRRRAAMVAEFVVAGEQRVEPMRALGHLRAAGLHSVLLEGGPGLNAEMVDAGALDELCLTVAPRLVAGSGPRLLAGPELPVPVELQVRHLLEEDGFLFGRFAVGGGVGGPRA